MKALPYNQTHPRALLSVKASDRIRLRIVSQSRQFTGLVEWAISYLPGTVTGDVAIVDGALRDLEVKVSMEVRRGKSVMVYGGVLHSSRVLYLMKLGVMSYVPDTSPLNVFLRAVESTAENGTHIPFEPAPNEGTSALTSREKIAADAYLLKAPLLPRHEVAAMLGIADATLRNHLASVRQKLRINPRTSRSALSRYYSAAKFHR
ncbi:DNA-binding NarL/FixJ family response regulator [Paenarthrobacter ilicis]|uniref:DNA-binding NarL/FixJ family response regulator n=1 Tax=Paenarthrobacter ilicis TaxID=43665 RepID=A0ABX0TP14_9MICC|nr:response regulator transcription factor [Paenarthrobacter ilicis]NIJ03431.1 DNA-binding NarL/FixJ family response regulator [Paenarthrobacter ilicis]